jgi:phospholipid:diacylglycerol acyltransferase
VANGELRSNGSCGDVWTEYHELHWDDVEDIASRDIYCAEDLVGLLRRVAPKLMIRGEENWGFGLADNLDDPKYKHFRHWSNPLETVLPNAPDMETFCLYGIGIPTERSYIYKVSPSTDSCNIPFRIDTSADGDSEGCLKGGVQFVDGDETVPALSAGYMCYKPWKGKTRFNPANSSSYVREYNHAPPANLLEGRGTQSGSHVDIMGNFALIEDILRVASGCSGEEIGGDRLYSDLPTWSERIKLVL